MNYILRKIKDFIQKATLTGGEEIPVNDNGYDRKITVNSIKAFVGTSAVTSVNGEVGTVVLTTDKIATANDKLYVSQAEKNAIQSVANKADINEVLTVNYTTPTFDIGETYSVTIDYALKNICIAKVTEPIALDFTIYENNVNNRKQSLLFITVEANISITLSGSLVYNDTRIESNVLALTAGSYLIEQYYNESKKYIEITPSKPQGDGAYPYNAVKDPTGFEFPDLVTVNYDGATRKVTITGTCTAYYKGEIVPEITTGWVSDAHADVTGRYYLSHNGVSFTFDTTPFDFKNIQIATIDYDDVTKLGVGIRETHGMNMPYSVHNELHTTIGTYLTSGGDLSAYVLNSTTAADRRPNISETKLSDEDNPTTNPALTSKLYTQRYLTGTGNKAYTLDQPEIIAVSGNQPYYNQWNGSAWVQTLMSNNEYGAIFVVATPATSDTYSQKYRYLFVQPQQTSGALSTIQALTPNNLTHGVSASLLSEFNFFAKIIIQYTSGNWKFISVEKISGTKINQSSQQGQFLTALLGDPTPTLGGRLNTNNKRVLLSQGSDVAAANNLSLTGAANQGNTFTITGNDQINLLDSTNWSGSPIVTLKFALNPLVKHGQTTSGVNTRINLAGDVDFQAEAGSVLVLQLIDGVWEEISRNTIGGSTGGGHVIQDNGTPLTQEGALNFIGFTLSDDAGNGATIVENPIISDLTGLANGDIQVYDETSGTWKVQSTAPFDIIQNTSFANLNTNAQITGALIPAGYKIDTIIIKNTTANSAGNVSLGTSAAGTQIVNAATIGASSVVDCTLVEDFFSDVNDTDIYISSSAWGTGVVTVYLTIKRVI